MQIRFYKYLLLMFVLVSVFFSRVYAQETADQLLQDLFSPKDLGLPDVTPHPSMPNVFVQKSVDPQTQKTVETILVATTVDGKREIVPIESMSTRELMPLLKQDTNFAKAFGGTVTNFPKEYGKFNAAMIAMEMVGCYGVGNGTLFSQWKWQPETNTNTPLCAEHLLKAMTTLEGNVGFFAFILGNRVASAHLTNLATATSLMINKPLTPKRMAALRPLIGYAGMSFGMAAQQIVSHILTIPDFKQCAKDIGSGQFGSAACKAAATHFLSAEKFWLDFGAGIPSLIGGAMMSAGTQKFIHFLAENAKFSGPTMTTKKARVAFLKKYFSSATIRKGIKVGKYIVRVGKMGAGVSIVVGEIVIFLVWTKVLEIPTMQWVWSLYDSPDIKSNAQSILNISAEIEKGQGIPDKNSPALCHNQMVNGRGGTKRICEPDLLAKSLKDLSFYSRRYRERVTLARLTRAYPDYMMKWENYISSFFAAKTLINEIYRQRDEKPTTQLSLYDTAYAVKSLWNDFLLYSQKSESYKIYLKNHMPRLESDFKNYKDSFATEMQDRTSLESKLANSLLAFKTHVDRHAKYNEQDPRPCGGFYSDAYLCRAMKILRFIPNKASDFLNRTSDSNVSFNIEFIDQLKESLPLENVLRQMLCAKDTQFPSSAKMDGLPAHLSLPRLITGHENNPLYRESCLFAKDNSLFLATDADESADFLDPKPGALWLLNFMPYKNPLVYIDPLSPLTDVRINLSSGANARTAQQWWSKNILPEIGLFYKKYISHYKKMLDDNLLSFMSYEAPEKLLSTSGLAAINAGGKIGGRNVPQLSESNLSAKVLNRQSVNLSLIGQMQIYTKALEKLANGFYPGPNQQKVLLKQKVQDFLLAFAEHTRHFYYVNEPAALDSIPIENMQNPLLFSQDVAKTLFADSYDKKSQRQQQLLIELGELSAILIGLDYTEIDNIEAELDHTPEKVAAMGPADYKKYTVLQIVHHMRLLVDETNEYYDKYLFLTGLFNLTNK